ncbi:MAG: hypothetical protein KKE02_17875 [Alphaproteobacteria bacterium]|nr:hypothetical protein [Alphaproteobacteria bacterium]MBU1515168.1 hypothetical protein [Alphaproteobacteria bacterium]MBU2092298.1 hypothetical protein [Alphaproteobacteria bacterium]MBU2152892.1 hypothetical protein [Alphaproteobacteria bacterium]MBU2305723.1 hypothetical protein [Alphaproteobacteria bacterium]
MSSSISGVGGAADLFGAAFRKPDVTNAGPNRSTDEGPPKPIVAQVPINGRLTLAQQVRAGLLQSVQLSESQIAEMQPDARVDFEAEMARQVQARLLADPKVDPGALFDVKA